MVVKKAVKKTKKAEVSKENELPKVTKFFFAVGRRKSSIAQVRIYEIEKTAEGDFVVNKKSAKEYFPTFSFQNLLFSPLKAVGVQGKIGFSILTKGGGKRGQVEAARLGISRALVEYNKDFRKPLKDNGFLTRDSRTVERKKPGLKKARRAPQWQKR